MRIVDQKTCCAAAKEKKYEWKVLILLFWDCWCCKTAFNIADISGNECKNRMLLAWKWSHQYISSRCGFDWSNRSEQNRRFVHIFVVVLPSKRTQFHSTWILHFICQSNIRHECFFFPTKSNQKKIRFSNFVICIFQIEHVERDYHQMDCHWPNKTPAIMWFSSSFFKNRRVQLIFVRFDLELNNVVCKVKHN